MIAHTYINNVMLRNEDKTITADFSNLWLQAYDLKRRMKMESQNIDQKKKKTKKCELNYSCDKFWQNVRNSTSNNHKQWHNHSKVISDVVICFVMALKLRYPRSHRLPSVTRRSKMLGKWNVRPDNEAIFDSWTLIPIGHKPHGQTQPQNEIDQQNIFNIFFFPLRQV